MTAIVQMGTSRAVIQDYKWTSIDKALADLLNAMLDPMGPSGADPNADGTAAEDAVKQLGGKVISVEPTEYEEGTVY